MKECPNQQPHRRPASGQRDIRTILKPQTDIATTEYIRADLAADDVEEARRDSVIDETHGPFGKLTADVFDAWSTANDLGDARALEWLHWFHEHLCRARTEALGGEMDRLMPQRPAIPMSETTTALDELRDAGWSVAIHNDYQVGGEPYTFWLLTHPNGRWVKGEGATDAYALAKCQKEIARYSMDGRVPQPYAVSVKDSGAGNGWVSLGFNTVEQAEQFWRWADRELANATR